MIQKYTAPLQKLAVGNDNYSDIIEKHLHIPCMSGPHVDELMWGLKVTKLIIEKAGVVFECDRCVDDHHDSLRGAAEHIKKISCIDTQSWDLLKLAGSVQVICCPKEKVELGEHLFTRRQLERLRDDAPKYKDKILKMPCLVVYNKILRARDLRLMIARVLFRLVKRAKETYEAEQAHEAASYHETGPDRKEIHHGTTPVIIDELTESVCDIILSAGLKERQIMEMDYISGLNCTEF
ncbi:hypothetical protein OsI_12053 [Oryza sativa Indica Group]|uniref:Uncharacterized protein n=1 Tax=Oryza sativa subsp. indica TaxID=39946 RepID=A2XI06_ORYSI|nr:hypothetical protein OsI_12053 [Oryza sativa Indica Group]